MATPKLYRLRRFFRDNDNAESPLRAVRAGLEDLNVNELLAVRQGAYELIAMCEERLHELLDDEREDY